MDAKELGFMATQYEKYGEVSEDDIIQVYIDEELDVDTDMLSDYNEYLSENSYETWFSFDDLDEELYGATPIEIIRMSYFGQFSFNDEYVTYNGYGNLKSCSKMELVEEMKQDREFLQWYVRKNNLIDDDEMEEALEWCRKYLAAGY
jgi:hypothetical protein